MDELLPGEPPKEPVGDRHRLLAEEQPGDNAPALSVSELSGALKRSVEEAFGHVRVRGEISGFKRHSSGHCYLSLKDDKACIDGVIWKGQAAAMRFRPEDGIEVVATGKLTTVTLPVPSYMTIDWQMQYKYNKGTEVRLGINNLTNQTPPFTLRDSSGHQVGYDARYADPKLRTFYVQGSYSF